MKKLKLTTLFIIVCCFIAEAQTDCGKDLKNAFKSTYILNTEEQVYNHFTELFEYSEAKLNEAADKYDNSDQLSGSYKAISAYWSRTRKSDRRMKAFREQRTKYQAGFEIDNAFLQNYYEEVVDSATVNAYVECLKIHQELEIETKRLEVLAGGFYFDFVGDLLSGFTFILNKKPAPGQKEEGIVTSVIPENIELLGSWILKPQAIIENYTGVAQQMKLRDPNRSGSLTINIDGFDPIVAEFPAYPYANFPVGSIILSALDFNAFSKETKNKMPYSDRQSKWAPADGRLVANSDYGKIYNQYLPDFRGQFIRGKNQFFNADEPTTYDNGSDLGSRFDENKYSYQTEATKLPTNSFSGNSAKSGGHAHTLRGHGGGRGVEHGVGTSSLVTFGDHVHGSSGINIGEGIHTHEVKLDAGGDEETRPKNIAVYFYIRINR